MSKCDCEVVRNFALEIEKLMHNLCPTDRANKVVIFCDLISTKFLSIFIMQLRKSRFVCLAHGFQPKIFAWVKRQHICEGNLIAHIIVLVLVQ